ncbi:MAG: MFS transporter [Leucobacter sp.]
MPAARPILPWVVWGVGAIAYAVAIINRSSLAALGPATQEHFGIDATTLSMFAMIQLIVYAALQIPVGTLLDRFGATALILVGGILMSAGQIVMATVADVWLAILARVLVGAGDACTFISVLRLLPEWFSLRQLPVVSQITALIGQAGQLVSVTPLALAVALFGWTSAFLGVAAVGVLVALLGACVLRDRPGMGTAFERMTHRVGRISRNARSLSAGELTGTFSVPPPETSMLPSVRRSRVPGIGFWRRARRLLTIPGVRLAFWMHFTTPFSLTVFVLLWGTPFLTGGVGLSMSEASGLLNLLILATMAAGFAVGPISSRFLEHRVPFYLGVWVAIVAVWLAVLLWPGTPPMWLLIVLMLVMPIGGPASMIAFEVARSHTPKSFMGFSTGLVNTGGFIAALLVIVLIGFILDLLGAGSPENYSLGAFRLAFAVQIPFWVLGAAMVVLERRRTQRWMDEHGRTLR